MQHTFAIHPTTPNPAPKQGPDELMIAWGNIPVGTIATVYLPGVRASEVLGLAARNFNLQTLERVDDHTIRCRTDGVTYIPIPAGGSLDLAGLITLDLPAHVRQGQTFRAVVRQVMDTPAPPAPYASQLATRVGALGGKPEGGRLPPAERDDNLDEPMDRPPRPALLRAARALPPIKE